MYWNIETNIRYIFLTGVAQLYNILPRNNEVVGGVKTYIIIGRKAAMSGSSL